MSREVDVFLDYANENSQDIELGTPAAEAEIAAFEARYNVKLPADVREYFLKINGIYILGGFIAVEALSDWDVVSEHKHYVTAYEQLIAAEPNNYFYCGHYDFSVWDWVIRLDSDLDTATPILFVPSDRDEIASDFSDFLRKLRLNGQEWLFTY